MQGLHQYFDIYHVAKMSLDPEKRSMAWTLTHLFFPPQEARSRVSGATQIQLRFHCLKKKLLQKKKEKMFMNY